MWRTEVSVLNRLSRRRYSEDEASGREGVGEVEDNEYEAWRGEIHDAVKAASKARDAKGRKVDGAGKKGKKGKRRKGEEEEDADDDADCCGEDH